LNKGVGPRGLQEQTAEDRPMWRLPSCRQVIAISLAPSEYGWYSLNGGSKQLLRK
jgi:hypothetical protein